MGGIAESRAVCVHLRLETVFRAAIPKEKAERVVLTGNEMSAAFGGSAFCCRFDTMRIWAKALAVGFGDSSTSWKDSTVSRRFSYSSD